MTHMLGRRDCILGLRKDLVDIQASVLDVVSRTGPVCQYSWKFPDKLSCDLDILALLEQYDYVETEETSNQLSHIALLELIIDRLLLLLQSFNVYVEQLRCNHRQQQKWQKGCRSAGLVVKSYWNNLILFAKNKETSKEISEQIKTNASSVYSLSSSSTDFDRHQLSAWSSTSSLNKSFSSKPNTPCYPVVGSRSVGSQTIESSLTPCDACHEVQSVLSKIGNALVDLLQSEGLPSSLQPLLEVVKDTQILGQMTAVDVAQWANEQLRDMRRLEKHLQDVRGTVEPLQERVTVAETELEKFTLQLGRQEKEFEKEIEKHQTCNVQLDFSLRNAERALKESMQTLKDEQQRRAKDNLFLEESSLKLKERITSQQNDLQALESERSVLQEKVKTLQMKEEAMCKLQERVQQLEIQVFDSQRLLVQETAKYKSACRQQESMQVKHKSLLERVDALDEECEDLQRRLENQEEKEVTLNKQLQEFSEEKQRLQALLNQEKAMCLENKKEKKNLETSRDELRKTVTDLEEYVQVLMERERLLVAFPELSPLAQAQSQGSDCATEKPAPTPGPAQAHTAPQYNTVHNEVAPAPPTRENAIDHPIMATSPATDRQAGVPYHPQQGSATLHQFRQHRPPPRRGHPRSPMHRHQCNPEDIGPQGTSLTLPKAAWRHTEQRPVPMQAAGAPASRGPTQKPAPEIPQPRQTWIQSQSAQTCWRSNHLPLFKVSRPKSAKGGGGGGQDETGILRVRGLQHVGPYP